MGQRKIASAATCAGAYICIYKGAYQGVSCACRKFLRRHIQQYLQKHMHMPPKSIVLVASLLSREKDVAAPATKESAAERLQNSQVGCFSLCLRSLEDYGQCLRKLVC